VTAAFDQSLELLPKHLGCITVGD